MRIFTVLAVVSLFSLPAMASHFPMPDLKGSMSKQNTKAASQMTVQADQMSFSNGDNKAHATGNVVVNDRNQHLFCDQLDLDRAISQVEASGDVYLDTPQEQIMAEGLTYNFNDGTGEFRNAKVYVDPYVIQGKKLDKISQNYMTMDEGYITTCDLDEPHYRIGAHRMDIYQHDRAVIHGMKVYIGTVPVMYMPYFVQDLKNRPIITFTPGDKKEFGLFLLTQARFNVGTHMRVTLHADVRERTGLGEGFDVSYNTPNFGSGLLSAYYTDENKIASSHLWNEDNSAGEKKGPTTHHELYRIIWRHRWQVDPSTNIVTQYYKIHDYDLANQYFLKNYFPKDYQQSAQNSNFDSYFLLTHNMPHGTLTINVDTSRENRPIQGLERLPEAQYTLNNQQIGTSGFYVKSTDTLSNLDDRNNPKTFNEKTLRFDSNDDISHPLKVGFISFNPHIGGEETYYSRTADIDENNILRGMFRGSLDMTTKFYRLWDYHTNFAGMNINGLRHVITPTITYLYQAKPTFPASRLNQFDSTIDDLYRIHQFEFGIQNELQTKRDGQVVDLARWLVTTNYGLKGTSLGQPQVTALGSPTGLTSSRRGFNPVDSSLDINPTDWLTFHNDNEYDFHAGHWNANNTDAEIHKDNAWAVSLGNRYTRDEGDMVTTEFDYTINPKWRFKIYNTFPVVDAEGGNTTSARENDYVLTRDLHEWEMDMSIDQIQGQGTTFFVLFRLKALPNMKVDLLQTSFQPSRPGTENQ